jgi:hypothetical protein
MRICVYYSAGTPQNHADLEASVANMVPVHPHDGDRIVDKTLLHSEAQISYPWGCAYAGSRESLFVTNGGPQNVNLSNDVLIELRADGQAQVGFMWCGISLQQLAWDRVYAFRLSHAPVLALCARWFPSCARSFQPTRFLRA